MSHKINIIRFFPFKIALGLLAVVLLSAFLAYIRVNNGYGFQSDTGQLYFLLENIHAGKGAFNQILPTLIDFAFRKNMAVLDSNTLCEMVLDSPHYAAADYNHFKFHTYLILYPASLLLYLFETPYVANGLNIFSFVLFLFLSYKISRKIEIPFFISIFTVIGISLHPAWAWAIIGQPYVDRLFLPLGLLLFYFTDNRDKPLNAILAVLVISALIVEKTIIYSGVFLISYSILYYKDYPDKRDFIIRLLLGITTLIIFYLTVRFYIDNTYYSSSIPYTVAGIINSFSNEISFNGIKSLLFVNAPLLLPALIFKPRLFLIALIMLTPNIIGSIGGAEKTGFYTHYHTLYFPFVVYAFINGIGELFRRFSLNMGICIFASYMIVTATFYLSLGFDAKQNIKLTNAAFANNYAIVFYNLSKDLGHYKHISTLVESNIPSNAKVTAIEAGLPALYKFQNLSFYPFDIEKSDFLLVGYEKVANQFYYSGYQGYLGDQHTRNINDCLNLRIKKAGYNVESPVILTPSLAILRRK